MTMPTIEILLAALGALLFLKYRKALEAPKIDKNDPTPYRRWP